MSESKQFKCPCKICLPILLIVLGVKLLAAELKGTKSKREDDRVRVLTVYAHPNPKSFCHAILQQFTKGLRSSANAPA